MPNETPKSKCCDAGILKLKDGVVCQKCLKVTSINELPKQSDDMPDVIYADCFRVKSWTTLPKEALTPYIRKSIHDSFVADQQVICNACENQGEIITKLKSALKECVEMMVFELTCSDECRCKGRQLITSAKGLYE